MSLQLGKKVSQGCMHEESVESNKLASITLYPLLSPWAHI